MAFTAKSVLAEVWAYRATWIIILTPLLTLPLPLAVDGKESNAGYVLILMAVYWATDVLPLSVTALLPLVLFPLMGVMTAKETSINYLEDVNVLLIGGLIMAIAIERCNLHKRMALRVLLLVGVKVRWLMLGFMVPTACLSMFISNTATAAMMAPIAHAVLMQIVRAKSGSADEESADQTGSLYDHDDEKSGDSQEDISLTEETPLLDKNNKSNGSVKSMETAKAATPPEDIQYDDMSEADQRMGKALLICIAYAASIGGTGTVIGTSTNIVMLGVIEGRYGTETGLDFASWLIYALPGVIVFEFITWLLLQFWFLGCRDNCSACCPCGKKSKETTRNSSGVSNVIRDEYNSLGKMSWAEGSVLIIFIVLIFLWMTRDIAGYGWGNLFEPGYVSDSTPVMLISVLLFILPAQTPNFLCCRRRNDDSPVGPRTSLLNWKSVHQGLPWGIILLLGGGLALAEGCRVSGLSSWLGSQLAVLDFMPTEVIVLISATVVCFFTEIMTNVAVATIFLPIMADLAESICVNPLYLIVPSAIACSYAFMLPVATPPNAIVVTYGHLTTPDMAKVGFVLSLIGIFVALFFINTYGVLIFDVKTYPAWAMTPNSTCGGDVSLDL